MLFRSVHETAAAAQEITAFLPDYAFAQAGENTAPLGTSTSGVVGAVITFALAGATGMAISLAKKARKRPVTVAE